jgi:hypothetical protein
MIRALVSILVLTCASSAFAAETCENLVLNCTALYQAYDGTAEVDNVVVNFADENPYEPSLKNCAARAYLPTRDATTIAVYAVKDLQSNVINYSAEANQIIETPAGRGDKRSETVRANATVGMDQPLGYVSLPAKVQIGSAYADSAHVRCKTSQGK